MTKRKKSGVRRFCERIAGRVRCYSTRERLDAAKERTVRRRSGGRESFISPGMHCFRIDGGDGYPEGLDAAFCFTDEARMQRAMAKVEARGGIVEVTPERRAEYASEERCDEDEEGNLDCTEYEVIVGHEPYEDGVSRDPNFDPYTGDSWDGLRGKPRRSRRKRPARRQARKRKRR